MVGMGTNLVARNVEISIRVPIQVVDERVSLEQQ